MDVPFEMASFLSVLEMEEEKASQGGREVTVAFSESFQTFPINNIQVKYQFLHAASKASDWALFFFLRKGCLTETKSTTQTLKTNSKYRRKNIDSR